MKKLRSKKGFTLVELIVTVAILAMVAGMGVGIVGQAIRNYSTAQTTSSEQETALSVESFLVGGSRVARTVSKVDASAISTDKMHTVFYLRFNEEGVLQTIRNDAVGKDEEPIISYESYQGVRKITLQMKKQKPTETDSFSNLCFMFLEYTIEMREGYTLKGSVVIHNADVSVAMKDDPEHPLVDYADKVSIIWDAEDATLHDSTNALCLTK